MGISRSEFLRLAGLSTLAVLTGCGGSGGGAPEIGRPGIRKSLDEYKNYVNLFGDIHVHTNVSDGDESPDYALRYARDIAKLDFCSLSDHAEPIANDGYTMVPHYKSMPGKYDEPGKFSVLYGFEWTNPYFGHRNVYSLDTDLPILPYFDPKYDTPEKLWNALSGYDFIAIPHHPMIQSLNRWYEFTDPVMEPVVEFYSKWGLSLEPGNMRPLKNRRDDNAVYMGIHEGHRFGLIGSTDTHLSRPASRLFECRPNALEHPEPGIVAVWAAEHTREAIFEALRNRRCFGTTGSRVNLQTTVDKAVMGSSIQAYTEPAIAFSASSDITITQVSIMKFFGNTHLTLKSYFPNALECEGIYTDTSFTEDASYLVRVDLANTDMALSSPVWVEKVEAVV